MDKSGEFTIYRVVKPGRNVDALVDVNVSDEEILRKKISEALNQVKSIYGDLTGLTLEQFRKIISRPELKEICKSNLLDFQLNCADEDEFLVTLFIFAEEFQKFGIIV